VVAGHNGDEEGARSGISDASPPVRASAFGALARLGRLSDADLARGLADPAPSVRRRSCELAGHLRRAAVAGDLLTCLADRDEAVVEAASYALGELGGAAPQPATVAALSAVATAHRDPLCREAAVAALGALGHLDGLPAVLGALGDKAAVRRRAVIALAGFGDAFDTAEVRSALTGALSDPDWQVRQGAEDMLDQRPRSRPARGQSSEDRGQESPSFN
jgi:HEAT repeat protein